VFPPFPALPLRSLAPPSLPPSPPRVGFLLRARGRIDEFLGVDDGSPDSNTEQPRERACVRACIRGAYVRTCCAARYSETPTTSAAGRIRDVHHFGTTCPRRRRRRRRRRRSKLDDEGMNVRLAEHAMPRPESAAATAAASNNASALRTISRVVFLAARCALEREPLSALRAISADLLLRASYGTESAVHNGAELKHRRTRSSGQIIGCIDHTTPLIAPEMH